MKRQSFLHPVTASATLHRFIKINGGATYTNSRNVTLSLQATDSGSGVKAVRFQQYDFDSKSPWSAWKAFSPTMNFTLLPGMAENG